MKNKTDLQKNVQEAIQATEIAVNAKDGVVSINRIKQDDNEITTGILDAFKWTQEVPDNKIKVEVENGWVTLQGELRWNFQSAAAKNAVKNVLGVTGISNKIKVITKAGDASEK
jgi:osmotically-inducible protein OsmY